jgi:hypothetical protein
MNDYYWDSINGSDSADGTIDSPFQSISKINEVIAGNLTYSNIYLRRGGAWTGTITGSSYITIDAWDTGDNPVIDGDGSPCFYLDGDTVDFHVNSVDGINGNYGLLAEGRHYGVEISNLTFSGNSQDGIGCNTGTGDLFFNEVNSVNNLGNGFNVKDNYKYVAKFCHTEDNAGDGYGVAESGAAFVLFSQSLNDGNACNLLNIKNDNYIIGNRFYDFSGSGIRHVPPSQGLTKTIIQGNILKSKEDTPVSNNYGIYISSSTGYIYNNYIRSSNTGNAGGYTFGVGFKDDLGSLPQIYLVNNSIECTTSDLASFISGEAGNTLAAFERNLFVKTGGDYDVFHDGTSLKSYTGFEAVHPSESVNYTAYTSSEYPFVSYDATGEYMGRLIPISLYKRMGINLGEEYIETIDGMSHNLNGDWGIGPWPYYSGSVSFNNEKLLYNTSKTLVCPSSFSYQVTGSNEFSFVSKFRYAYSGVEATSVRKRYGWRSDYTQVIANGLQDWNRIRNCQDSTGQYFINASAMGIEDINGYWLKEYKNLWLASADRNTPWKLNRVELPENLIDSIEEANQLLVNGGFTYRGLARYNLPEGWSDNFSYTTASVSCYDKDVVTPGYSLKIEANTGEKARISQSVKLNLSKGVPVTFSLWHKNNESSSYTSQCQVKMKLSMEYADSYVDSYEHDISQSTSGEWIRSYFTASGEYDVGHIIASIELFNTGDVSRTYFFDALQLERGNSPTQWCSSQSDYPFSVGYNYQPYSVNFIPHVNNFGITGSGPLSGYSAEYSGNYKIPMFLVERGSHLLNNELCPTRVTYHYTEEDLTGVSNKIHGIIATNLDGPTEKGWQIYGENALQTYMWPNRDDTGSIYYIHEPGVNKESENFNQRVEIKYANPSSDTYNKFIQNYSIYIKDFTFKYGYIWAICEESYNQTQSTVLKIISPKTEYNENYIELIKDFSIPVSGTPTSIGFMEDDPPRILISLTGETIRYSGAVINLHYDYYDYDLQEGYIYFRENYDKYGEKVVIL